MVDENIIPDRHALLKNANEKLSAARVPTRASPREAFSAIITLLQIQYILCEYVFI